jgi:hypothetical protein
MHETDPGTVGASAAVEIYSLNEGTGTVTHPYDRNSDFSHSVKAIIPYPEQAATGKMQKRLV